MFDELTDLREIAEELSPDARKVLLYCARRIKSGQVQYGRLDLKTDKRNFPKEKFEELVDLMVYTGCEVIQAQMRANDAQSS